VSLSRLIWYLIKLIVVHGATVSGIKTAFLCVTRLQRANIRQQQCYISVTKQQRVPLHWKHNWIGVSEFLLEFIKIEREVAELRSQKVNSAYFIPVLVVIQIAYWVHICIHMKPDMMLV